MTADTGTAAACSKLRFAGIGASLSGCAGAYSANAALLVPYTASPGWRSVTFAPTASTTPASSEPSPAVFGARSAEAGDPDQVGQPGHDVPRAAVQPGRVDAHEHLVVGDLGHLHVAELEDVGRAVAIAHDGSHRSLALRCAGHS